MTDTPIKKALDEVQEAINSQEPPNFEEDDFNAGVIEGLSQAHDIIEEHWHKEDERPIDKAIESINKLLKEGALSEMDAGLIVALNVLRREANRKVIENLKPGHAIVIDKENVIGKLLSDDKGLKQCPHSRATRCVMNTPCEECEHFEADIREQQENEAHQEQLEDERYQQMIDEERRKECQEGG